MDEEADTNDMTHPRSLMEMLFRLNSNWFCLGYKAWCAVYFKEETCVMCRVLGTVKQKEITSLKLGPGIWLAPELFCKMLI